MNPLGEQVLQVAKQYLGPAAQQFLSKELRVLQCTADTITPQHLPQLADRAKISALRIMDAERAGEFALSVVSLGVPASAAAAAGGGRAKEGNSLEAAAHLYASGKLRQAEESYRAIVQKHADPDAYRGLAATQVALEDIPAALLALRDGAAILARRGDRPQAIVLLTEAVGIAPGDLAAHRRLAAAHANAGDSTAACGEYERFVDYVLAEGDSRRAWLELTYARETLGDLSDLIRLVDRLMPGGAAAMPTRAAAPAARAVSQQVSPPPPSPAAVRRLVPEPPAPQRTVAADLPKTKPTGSQSAMVMADARTMTSVDAFDEAPVDLAQRIAPRTKDAQRKLSQAAWHARPAVSVEATLATLTLAGSPEQQAAVIAMRATVLIGARDPRATEVAIDAARRFLSMHKLQAASDLLLDYIGAGYTDREAQRLLIEVDCGLGRRDVARDKCRLLGEAYRLDGRIDIANDVERLASMI